MNKPFYIKDTTIGGKYVLFETTQDLVKYFNNLIPRAFNTTKDQYVQYLAELGMETNDREGVMLTRVLGEQFDIGVVKNNTYVRTDVHTANHFRKEEYGDVTVNSMKNLEITWSKIKKFDNDEGDTLYRREWKIPTECLSAFFEFWKESKYTMKDNGFSVSKINNDWYLYETKETFSNLSSLIEESAAITKKDEWTSPSPHKLKNDTILRSWQKDSVSKLVSIINKIGCSIDGSEFGTGKTYSACGVARELDIPFVVVCPKAVRSQWNNVIRNQFKLQNNHIETINYEMLIRGKKDSKIASFVLNKKTHREKLKFKLPKDTLLIFDEAHKLKNPKTKASKTAMLAFKEGYKMLFLSGSIATTPLDLKTIGQCLGMFKGGKEYTQWLYDHSCVKGKWGMEFLNDKEALKRMHKMLFKDRGIRIKRDAIPNFPECEIIAEAYDMDEETTNKINAIYAEMKIELQKIKNKIKQDGEEQNELTIRLRARQAAEILKTPLIIELVEEGIEAGMSVVVFLNYSATIDAIANRFNTTCIFDGRLKDEVRDENKMRFQRNEEKLIIVNLAAGGMGLDFPDSDGKHPRLAIISPDDSAPKVRQATGRIWRESSMSRSLEKLFFIKGTVEEKVMENVQQKLSNMDMINDGDLKI